MGPKANHSNVFRVCENKGTSYALEEIPEGQPLFDLVVIVYLRSTIFIIHRRQSGRAGNKGWGQLE